MEEFRQDKCTKWIWGWGVSADCLHGFSRLCCKTWKALSITRGHAAARLSSLIRRDGVPSPLPPTELSRRGAALEAHGWELDQIRPFWQVSDEPKQSQYHEKDDEQHQAMPRSGLWLRAINPVKFHRRVPQAFQPLHQGAHPRVPSVNLLRLLNLLEVRQLPGLRKERWLGTTEAEI
jgi:hypothetical protein